MNGKEELEMNDKGELVHFLTWIPDVDINSLRLTWDVDEKLMKLQSGKLKNGDELTKEQLGLIEKLKPEYLEIAEKSIFIYTPYIPLHISMGDEEE